VIVMRKSSRDTTSGLVDKGQLLKLRRKAMRAGVWFRSLRRIDRVLVDLTIKVVADNVRSFKLAESILSVKRKLEGLLVNRMAWVTRQIGVPLAGKLSLFAQKWGNVAAKSWASDLSFARFLAVMNLKGSLLKP
jgi:hypothetical protein